MRAVTRRRVLRGVGLAGVAATLLALAGCTALAGDRELTVTVTNEDEMAHTVGGRVTDSSGTVVEEFPPEAIQPGIGTSFAGTGFGGEDYLITVEEHDGDRPLWKQTTRWSQVDACPSLTYSVRITRDSNGAISVLAEENCGST